MPGMPEAGRTRMTLGLVGCPSARTLRTQGRMGQSGNATPLWKLGLPFRVAHLRLFS